jgi:hypothetical protein
MLLTFQGFFKDGRFITDTPDAIPEGRKTIVTVLDEVIDKNAEEKRRIELWDKIIEDIKNSDEVLAGEPERMHFRTPEEVDAL